jgi:hypothetical protein
MSEPERPERFELRVTDIDDPLPDTTFGSIDRYVEVARPDGLDEPLILTTNDSLDDEDRHGYRERLGRDVRRPIVEGVPWDRDC